MSSLPHGQPWHHAAQATRAHFVAGTGTKRFRFRSAAPRMVSWAS